MYICSMKKLFNTIGIKLVEFVDYLMGSKYMLANAFGRFLDLVLSFIVVPIFLIIGFLYLCYLLIRNPKDFFKNAKEL